jgi:hypothetical protein
MTRFLIRLDSALGYSCDALMCAFLAALAIAGVPDVNDARWVAGIGAIYAATSLFWRFVYTKCRALVDAFENEARGFERIAKEAVHQRDTALEEIAYLEERLR